MTWLLLLFACASAEGDSGTCEVDPDGWRPTWTNEGQGLFRGWCASCHSAEAPQRFGAPEDAVFDTEADVLRQLSLIRTLTLGPDPTMPLGGGMPPDELDRLARYLDCAAAERDAR